MEIAASLSSELVSVLRSDLELRINKDGKSDAEADQGLKDRLKPLLLNLVRTKGLKEGIMSWREVVLIEVKGVVRKVGFFYILLLKRRMMMLWAFLYRYCLILNLMKMRTGVVSHY